MRLKGGSAMKFSDVNEIRGLGTSRWVDGVNLIRGIRTIYNNHPDLGAGTLLASIRHPRHVSAALERVDVATRAALRSQKYRQPPSHRKGQGNFLADWRRRDKPFCDE
jgi:hypothetical protein